MAKIISDLTNSSPESSSAPSEWMKNSHKSSSKDASTGATRSVGVWESETLFFDGDSFFESVLSNIRSAKSSILLETYIYEPDAIGNAFDQALKEAASRGLKVRLLVDGFGAAKWAEAKALEMEKSGVQVRIFHPLWISSIVKKGLQSLSRINRRDHRKICLVDDSIAYVGSLNISGCHSKNVSGADAWRDTAVQVQGEGISDLKIGFEYAWIRAHTPNGKRRWRESLFPMNLLKRRRKLQSPLVLLNFTLRLRKQMYKRVGKQVERAERRVWITNAYLAPSANAVKKLAEAAQRGLDVRVLVPRKSDVFFMPWIARAHYTPLLKAGVRVFEYLPRFLHAKSVIIDDWPTVGTSNLNRRSLLYDFEVDLVLTKKESLMALEEQYLRDLNEAEELLHARGGFVEFVGRALSFFFGKWI